ncbi:MAG TPA: hypothetical protein VF140_02280 [Phycicoccus sp.]
MNVVLLSAARRCTPETVGAWREQLGVVDAADVSLALVALHRPGHALPWVDTIVLGKLSSRGRTQRLAAAPAGSAAPDGAVAPAAALAAQAPQAAPAPVQREGVHRLVHGVRWRYRRARRAATTHPLARRVAGSTKVRRIRSAVSPLGPASAYSIGALAAPGVHALVAGADVVVALDADTYRAAWLLARRHPGPDVVVGTAAGKQAIARRRWG